MPNNKPLPKNQQQLSQDSIKTYGVEVFSGSKQPINDLKKRELQRSVKDDNVKQFTLGLRDIDESIFYYFNNVIRPSVMQNGAKKEVPVLYGSPERWHAVQKEGFYRDRNGKIQLPLIMVKRDSIEKNRQLGNKMDANLPTQFGVFEKKWSKKNQYDRFSALNNRSITREYQGVVMPDYINIVYSCVIFTQYIEQMNKLIESINYASDAYWGNPDKFSFRAMIDNYTTSTTLNQGEDRTVKTEFNINLLGHVVPNGINTLPQGSAKFFNKSAVFFGTEVVKDINDI
jgi:hypothetical protein